MIQKTFTFEEVDEALGVGEIEATARYQIHPGEPRVMYYPDGSGYPGSPDEVEILDVHVDAVTDWEGNLINVTQRIRDKAQQLVEAELEDNSDLFLEF
jgi:hypothetical protein